MTPIYKLDVSDAIRGLDIIAGGDTFAYDGTLRARNAAGNTNLLLRSSGSSYFLGGDVGIGTTTPIAPLHIYSSNQNVASTLATSYTNAKFRLEPFNTSGVGISMGMISPNINYLQGVYADGSTTAPFVIQPYGNNVGIGTNSPSSKLYVRTTAGATKAYDDLSKTNIMCFDDTSMVEGVGGSITFGGYKTSTSAGGNFAAIDGIKENGTAGNEAGAFRIWTANGSGVFGERMRITSAGQVAIGATSNLNNFTIKSSSDTITAGGLSFQSRTAVTNYIAMGLNSSNDFEIQTWTTPSWLTRIYIKNDGNIGIGKTPEAISTFRTLDIQGSTGAGIRLSDATNATNLQSTGGDFYINNISSGVIYFYNGNTERMRITSTGNLNFNTAGSGTAYINVNQPTGNDGGFLYYRNNVIKWQHALDNSDNMVFYSYPLSANAYKINSNGTATLYGALTQNASDRRLKNNITNIPNALDKIKTLNGVTFTWENEIYKTDKTNDIGVIAQEIQSVLPDAVTLAPFDIDSEGNSKSGENYLTVYYEKLIPLLIEGIKELKAEFDEYKTTHP
jgi:hypothetical protein